MHLVEKEELIDREIQRLKNTSVGANKEIQHFLEAERKFDSENGGNSGRTDLQTGAGICSIGSD